MNRRIPWPRVGQEVRLKSGVVGQVLTVQRGVDALRGKTDVEIWVLAPEMQSLVGADWSDLYYEATVQLASEALLVVTPMDVAEVLA